MKIYIKFELLLVMKMYENINYSNKRIIFNGETNARAATTEIDAKYQSLPLDVENEENDTKNKFFELFSDFCDNTSLHGAGYIGSKSRNTAEK